MDNNEGFLNLLSGATLVLQVRKLTEIWDALITRKYTTAAYQRLDASAKPINWLLYKIICQCDEVELFCRGTATLLQTDYPNPDSIATVPA